MTFTQISALRFFNQHIKGERFNQPEEIVNWLGAVQAQDYNMAKWALGVRLPGATNDIIEEAINSGKIIRTHILRPTWHFVTAADARWMMELSAGKIQRLMTTYDRQLGLDEKIFRKCNGIIEKLLRDGNCLTRKEIMSTLEKKGIPTSEFRAAHIMVRAETDMVVCNGPKRGKQFTYVLFDARIPAIKLTKEEKLAALAQKYFQSHGPASLQDFAWWSGLSVVEAREALGNIKDKMIQEIVQEKQFWFYPPDTPAKTNTKTVFLPAFDEFLISYRTREVSLDPKFSSKTFTINGIFNPVMVHKSKVIGLWKPQIKKQLSIQQSFFAKASAVQTKSCNAAAKEFALFMGMR